MQSGIVNGLFSMDWSGMLIPALSVLEKIVRPIIVYVFLIVALRLAGKRQMAQMNSFDFVVLLVLSNTVQNAIIGNDNSLSGGLIGAATLLVINHFAVRWLFHHERLDAVLEGSPDLLVADGKVDAKGLKRELITSAEIEIAARKQGIASLSEVRRAEMEPGGEIVFTTDEPRPDVARHREVLAAVERLSREIAELRSVVEQLPRGSAARGGAQGT